MDAGRPRRRASPLKAKDVVDTASDVKDAVGNGVGNDRQAARRGITGREARGDGGGKKKLSHLIEQHIDVAVPREVAYDQWTQFEEFATIMKAVDGVERQDARQGPMDCQDRPRSTQWLAKITEQKPPERISWSSTGGVQTTGVVTFHRLDRDLTRIMVQMEYDPRGLDREHRQPASDPAAPCVAGPEAVQALPRAAR